MKPAIKILLFLILSGCVTTKFTTFQNFDPPVHYERSWDDSVTAIYLPNLENIWEDGDGSFTLFANDSVASRLVTKETFSCELPFTITFEIKAKPADNMLYGVWGFPVDYDSFLVSEPDYAEITGSQLIFSLHRDENGYGGHWSVSKYFECDVNEWHKIKCRVNPFDITWWVDGKKVYHVKKDIAEVLYYLRISIIVTKRVKFPQYPKEGRMDIKNIKIRNL